jgi:hypothetical protein
MSFANEASKLLTNKYFLYFIVFLAITNVLGYLVTNKLNAVVFFALISLLMANFSKNMVVVLIVAIVATNLLMVNGKMREGLENADGSNGEQLTEAQKQEIQADVQADVQAVKNKRAATGAAPVSSDSTTDTTTDATSTDTTTSPTTTSTPTPTPTPGANAQALKAKAQAKQAADATTDSTAATSDTSVDEGFAPAGVGASGKKRGAIGGPAKPSRIDYASTLEDAYDNLDKILGSGGMQNLSADTEKLMTQQKKLFEAMNTMMPLVSKAQDMLQGLDMGKIGQMVNMTKKNA